MREIDPIFRVCLFCVRYHPPKPDEIPVDDQDNWTPSCEAFPAGIPRAVWESETIHDHPVEGDHGLRFEPVSLSANDGQPE